MRIVKCPICGRSFETARPNKKYCCLVCREAGKQLNRLHWEKKNPNYNQSYYQRNKQRKSQGKPQSVSEIVNDVMASLREVKRSNEKNTGAAHDGGRVQK